MRRVIRDTSQRLNRLRRDDVKDEVKNVAGTIFRWTPSLTVDASSYALSGTTGVIAETPVNTGTNGLSVYLSGTAGFVAPSISVSTGVA